jgi:argininosuccinate synthase
MNIKDTKIVLFSDDTNILVRAENGQILQHKINKVMNELHSCLYANSLTLNTEKTIAIPFHTRQEIDPVKPRIKFGNMDIAYKSETK